MILFYFILIVIDYIIFPHNPFNPINLGSDNRGSKKGLSFDSPPLS